MFKKLKQRAEQSPYNCNNKKTITSPVNGQKLTFTCLRKAKHRGKHSDRIASW